jgi:hypothetical protein
MLIKTHLKTNSLLLKKGDWNFDCTYISEKNRNIVKAKLFEFKWFISDKVETTISASNCGIN